MKHGSWYGPNSDKVTCSRDGSVLSGRWPLGPSSQLLICSYSLPSSLVSSSLESPTHNTGGNPQLLLSEEPPSPSYT